MKIPFDYTGGMEKKEWLLHRRKGIGGSDVAAILGLSPWVSPYQVWADKTGRVPIDLKSNEFEHWGTIMEPILANEFEAQTRKKVFRQNKTFYDPKYPFLRADIDRDVAGEDGFLEIKTAMEYKSDAWSDEQIPGPYRLQVQHYMYVLNRPYCYFAYLIGGHRFGIKRYERDDELINQIEPQLIDWWDEHIIHDEAPDPDGSQSTTDILKLIYPRSESIQIELPSIWNQKLHQHQDLKNNIKILAADNKRIENELRVAMKNGDTADTENYHITYRSNKNGNRMLRITERKNYDGKQ
ncbi:YqaJ viral recombinase family protein [Pediococcus parvulus]|uniref:YqaJ viral recombinase family nuclease n=1 Tax=Pediococcus parvulus TaxID=54062 RepID=UPI00345ED753